MPARSAATRHGWRSAAISAGGNLSAIVCQQLRPDEPRPAGQLLIYPWLDATLSLPSAVAMPDAYILPRPFLEWYTDLYLPDRSWPATRALAALGR